MKKRLRLALPWLIACVYANSYADPMRPLVPPPNPASAAEAATAGSRNAGGERVARTRDADSARELERLVAIRQDSVHRWQALFGERWLNVGDRLDSYTVTAIEANAVQLAEGRQRRTLHLLPPLWRPGPNNSPSLASAAGATTDVAQAGAAVPSPHRANGLSTP